MLRLANPAMEMRVGAAAMALFFVGFVGWSAVARLDAAVHRPAVLRVAGDRQPVQAAQPGLVRRVAVREGARVRQGQLLIELMAPDAAAQERALAGRVFGLQAEIARIAAEREGLSRVAAPADWATISGEERALTAGALRAEQQNLEAWHRLRASQRGVLRERVAQIGQQIDGVRERQIANARQSELYGAELEAARAMYAKGYASRTRVLALERSAAELRGETGAAAGELGRLHAQIGEVNLQTLQIEDDRQRQNAERLRAAETELQVALPQWRAAREQVAHMQVRAPVDGVVMGLSVNGTGAVVAAGQRLAEIVPDARPLVAEARLSPADVANLRVGQHARLFVGAPGADGAAPLDAVIDRISADRLTDDRTGQTYFTASLRISPAEIARARRETRLVGAIRTGAAMNLVVPVKARTALAYWLEPLTRRMRGALSEQ